MTGQHQAGTSCHTPSPLLPSRATFKDMSMKPCCAEGSFPVKQQARKCLPLGQSRGSTMDPSPFTAVALGRNWVRERQPIHLIQARPLHSAFSLRSFQSKEALFPLENKQNKLSPCSLIWGFCVADGLNRSNLLSSPGTLETVQEFRCGFRRQKVSSLPPA